MSTALKLQLIAFLLYAINYNVDLHHGNWELSSNWGPNLFFLLHHGLLFFLVTYVLVPRLLYTRQFVGFGVALIALVSLFAVGEEVWLERWFFPDSRGRDEMSINNLLYYFGEVGFPLLGFLSLQILTDADTTRLRLQDLEKERLGNELKALRSQIQPHILFNSLNNLYEYVLRGERAAPELVLRLSRVLRYVLYETREERVDLTGEINFLTDYIGLQRMQLEGRGNVKSRISPPAKPCRIAPFLLIPFVENCFKHSLGSLPRGIEIQIALRVEGEKLRLETRNNYKPEVNPGHGLTYSGIGLENVRKRLDLLYPSHHQLDIEEDGKTFRVLLSINLAP